MKECKRCQKYRQLQQKLDSAIGSKINKTKSFITGKTFYQILNISLRSILVPKDQKKNETAVRIVPRMAFFSEITIKTKVRSQVHFI